MPDSKPAAPAQRQAAYIDESGKPQPAWTAKPGPGVVNVYGDHLIGSFSSPEGVEVNLEVRGGRLFLYAFGGDPVCPDDVYEVAFTAEQSRAVLRAASHMLVGNTMAAVKLLDAKPEPALTATRKDAP